MTVPRTVAGAAVLHADRVAGGDINDAYAVELDDGRRAFVKTRDGAQPGEYAVEAAGLAWLEDGGARVPQVLEAGDDFLALEWLEREPADQEELGRRLATMHRAGAERFGTTPHDGDTLIGPLVLPNEERADWATFYADCRLRPLARRAGLQDEIERVCARLPDLVGPDEPPARLHGDLWSGNVFGPYLIDPAAYGGHREIDLAMLELFGSPSARLLAAYDEVWPRTDGHEDRQALHQLFPLLVHAVLFGGGYVAQARAVARGYA